MVNEIGIPYTMAYVICIFMTMSLNGVLTVPHMLNDDVITMIYNERDMHKKCTVYLKENREVVAIRTPEARSYLVTIHFYNSRKSLVCKNVVNSLF